MLRDLKIFKKKSNPNVKKWDKCNNGVWNGGQGNINYNIYPERLEIINGDQINKYNSVSKKNCACNKKKSNSCSYSCCKCKEFILSELFCCVVKQCKKRKFRLFL